MTTSLLWSALAGKASQSAAFGPSSPMKEETIYSITDSESSVDVDLVPRVRSVEIDGSGRSKSADSDVTLVENDLSPPKSVNLNGGTTELAEAGPSFTIDNSNSGLVCRQGHWQITNQELYHRLQNISQYPSSTLVIARRHLMAELEHLLQQDDITSPTESSIMSLPIAFDIDTLDTFLQRQHDATTHKFAFYSARRKGARQKAREAGMSIAQSRSADCEMFDEGVEQCIRWLEQASVVKYVDGSWLAHLYRNTTGISPSSIPTSDQRKAARASWLVMSEELGDGDAARSHVAIYERLMNRFSERRGEPIPPKGEDRRFTEWKPVQGGNISNDRCWRAACVQLCLSTSPSDFLPEALGFNLAYESLPYHLLVSAREIEDLLDADAAYHFYLHISIDNSASGHSAMARKAVIEYLEAARKAGREALANEMWARVKLGYALAEAIPTTPLLHQGDQDTTPEHLTGTMITAEDLDETSFDKEAAHLKERRRDAVIDILSKKAKSAAGLHASVTAQLAGRSISEWLDAKHFKERVPQLLDALSDSVVWIKRGDAEGSRFVREFEWGGKMFGAMTAREVTALKEWVNSLDISKAGSFEEEERPVVQSDQDAERPARDALRQYLSSHTDEPSTHWIDAEKLRPLIQPSTYESWGKLGKHLYPTILERPDAQQLPLLNQRKLLESLAANAFDLPSQLRHSQIKALIPTLLLTTSPLEQVISASCGRLSSHLGMSCVKILRNLLGFTETSLPDSIDHDRDVGCMGTDDLEDDQMGIWEIVQQLHHHLDRSDAKLEHFMSRDGGQLGLPALMMHLGSDLWGNMPILLGITLYLTSTVLSHPSILALFEKRDSAVTLNSMAFRSSVWLEYAVSLPTTGQIQRGVPDCDWNKDVELGKRLAISGIGHIINSVASS